MNDINEVKKDKKENRTDKKRDIIKNVLIIFLAILLILTFFSNTIMNRSLAEVSTERTQSGKLTERLRGSGMVESNQSYGVTIDGNRVVDTVMVKSGKEVKKGDVLFTVGTGESEELTAAEDNLTALELAYQKALLTPPADYTSENQAIKNAREDLNEAISKRDNAIANQGNVQAEKDNYRHNKSQYNSYTKLQTKLSAIIMAIDMDEYSSAPVEYTGDLITCKNNADDAEKEYNIAYNLYMSLVSGGSNNLTDDFTDTLDTSDITDFTEPYDTDISTTTSEVSQYPSSDEDIQNAYSDMETKKSAYDAAKENYDTLKYTLRQDYANQLAEAEYYIEYYSGLIDDYESNAMESDSIEALEADVTSKQRVLEELIASLDKTMKDDETQDKITDLDLNVQKKEIEKAKKQVEKLKKEVETTEILSEHSGIVNSVNIKAGDTTIPDMELVVIDIADEGYTVKITVDGEKSKSIKKGVEAEVVNNWSGDIQAILTDIKNDTTANSKNRILVFSVTGDVDSGSFIDLSIPCGSGNYDTIVPKSAVHEDSEGKFVLVVQSKSSPLGNRYYAQKVAVEVVASDEVSSAVSGNISSSDYVLTASSTPVSAGDQVRMKEK